jgi:hypothetical protein
MVHSRHILLVIFGDTKNWRWIAIPNIQWGVVVDTSRISSVGSFFYPCGSFFFKPKFHLVLALSFRFVDLISILLIQGERGVFVLPLPRNTSWGKGDLNNLVKFILDVMGGAAFADDQQIAHLTCKKFWGEDDGSTSCIVTILEEYEVSSL